MTDPADRRVPPQISGAYVLAILYTAGFLCMIGLLMFREIPTANRELLLTLAGIMSAAQLGIIKYFYDGSQGADTVQAANIARSVKSEAVVQEIARAAPSVVTVPAVAPSPPAASIVTESMQVDAKDVTVNQPDDVK